MSFLPDPLHPAVVHFPMALTLVALFFEALARVPRWRALESGAVVLIVLAALGSVAAVVSGKLAHEEAVVATAARALVEQHDELGLVVMGALLLLAGARVMLARSSRQHAAPGWLYLALLCLAAALVGYQAHLGGRLVYDHGVGTAPPLFSTQGR